MNRIFRGRDWNAHNPDLWLDVLRIYVGIALFIKGVVSLRNAVGLATLMHTSHVPFAGMALAELASLAHVAGGLMLAYGIFTRVGAAIQIPNLLSAVLFVHLREGLFTQAQTLEFALLVLFLLVVFALSGAGPWSVDYHFRARRPLRTEVTPAPRMS